MTMVVAVINKNKIKIASDTRLSMVSGHADVGSKLYKISNKMVLGMAGLGAFAHHLLGDFFDAAEQRELNPLSLFEFLKRFGIDQKIKGLCGISIRETVAMTFLAVGFTDDGEPIAVKYHVDKETFDLEMEQISPTSDAEQSYTLAIIGTGAKFEPEVRYEIQHSLQIDPKGFPVNYLQILKDVCDSKFKSVGGLVREYTIEPRGIRREHAISSKATVVVAGVGGLGAIDERGVTMDDYNRKLVLVIGCLLEDLDDHYRDPSYGDLERQVNVWLKQLRSRAVVDPLLLKKIPEIMKLIPQFRASIPSVHQQIVDEFISTATSKIKS